MPTYKDIQDRFASDSRRASEGVKTSALAGVAAVWIVSQTHKDGTATLFSHSRYFEFAALLFIISLALDLFHAFASSFVFWKLTQDLDAKYENDKVGLNSEHRLPTWATWIPWSFYVLKAIALLTATILLCLGVGLNL